MKRKAFKLAIIILAASLLAAAGGCSENAAASPRKTASEIEAASPREAGRTNKAPSAGEPLTAGGGIRDMYKRYGIRAGTCLSEAMLARSGYTDIIKANFGSVTPENLMKPDYILNKAESIAKGDLVVEFTKRTTDLLDWAKENGMSVRGHTLIWHSQTPDWIFYAGFDKSGGLVDRDAMLARMESYIRQVFGLLDSLGYSDMFYAYDVVNEAIMEDGSYRDSLWRRVIGDDYIWQAFKFAAKYAPDNIKLFYNDYNEQYKTDGIIRLARSLTDRDGSFLIDGLGCQGHLYTQDAIDGYIDTLKAFSALGLDVQITELDVCLGSWKNALGATEENLRSQGKYYYELINRIIEGNKAGETCVSAITFWGFADGLSWRSGRNPLLFDGDLKPKYAYYGALLDRARAGF